MATKTISATVDEAVAEKLNELARETNRKKSYFVNQALIEYFESLEDYEIAFSRRGGETVSLNEAEKELGI